VHDLRWLRDDAAAFDRSLARRGLEPAAAPILSVDEERRALETALQERQAERNRLSREIGEVKRTGGDAEALLARVAALKDEVKEGEERLRVLQARLDELLASHPNRLADDVPDGPDADHNRVVAVEGEPRRFAFAPKPHEALGARLGMSFEKAARLSGARFVALLGPLARLERALSAFMLDLQTREHGYTEVSVPLLVRDEALFGTGQLPKFAQDLFRVSSGHWLIPTAEVPLTNLVAGEILAEDALPLRFTACTPCFRSEAGAAGKDTRGMLRQHQFWKVELVSVTTPEASAAEHERMTACAEAVLRRLDLPFRRVLLCSGDTGFAASKTFDLEVWLPGQGAYREISSCSNCGDFQARRMQARFRPRGGGAPRFVHTLNGSGLAVGRTLIAVLENGQEADGSIRLPGALVPYMDGVDRLEPEG
jgi:seryl-tRNA synthetase